MFFLSDIFLPCLFKSKVKTKILCVCFLWVLVSLRGSEYLSVRLDECLNGSLLVAGQSGKPLNGSLLSACWTPPFQRVLLNIVIQLLYCLGLLLPLQCMCNALWSESAVYPRPPSAVKEPVKSRAIGAGYVILSTVPMMPLRLQGVERLSLTLGCFTNGVFFFPKMEL